MKRKNYLLFVFVLILMSFINPVSVLAEEVGRDGIPYSIRTSLDGYFYDGNLLNPLDEQLDEGINPSQNPISSIIKEYSSYPVRVMANATENGPGQEGEDHVFGPNPDSNDTSNANYYTITIYVDDGNGNYVPYESNMELKDGTPVQIFIEWDLNDETKEFELDLGDLSKLSNFDTSLVVTSRESEGNHSYTVSFEETPEGTVKVKVKYDDDCDCTSRKVSIEFKGLLDLDPRDDTEDGDNSFKIGDENIPYTPDYQGSSLDVNKTHGSLELGSDGEFYLTYTVSNTVQGKVTNPIFYDDLPADVSLVDDTVTVEFTRGDPNFNDYNPDPAEEGIWTVQNPASGHSFAISSTPDMTLYTGDIITYTYKVKIDKSEIYKILTSTYQIENTAYSESAEKGFGQSTNAYPGKNFQKPQIAKSGTTSNGQEVDDQITWTITWDPMGITQMLGEVLGLPQDNKGSYSGDVLGTLLDRFDGSDEEKQKKAEAFFDSIFGENAHFITDEIIGDNHSFVNSDEAKFSVFDMVYNPETGTYSKTITTQITDGPAGENGQDGWQNSGVGAGADKKTGKVEKDLDFNYLKSYLTDRSTDKLQQTWEIEITKPRVTTTEGGLLHKNMLEMHFTDTLPAETEYVEGSAYVTFAYQSVNNNQVSTITIIDLINNDADLAQYYAEDKAALEEKINNFQSILNEGLLVTDQGETILIDYSKPAEAGAMIRFREILNFDFGNGHTLSYYLNRGSNDWYLAIRYDTRVPDGDAFDRLIGSDSSGNNRVKFENTVQGTINDVEGPEREASTTTTFRQSLQKSNVYTENPSEDDTAYNFSKKPVSQFLNNTGNGYQSIYFEIAVNQDKMTFSSDGKGRLILVDEMGADLSIIPYSIQVIEVRGSANGNELTQVGDPLIQGEQTEKGFTYSVDSKNNRITFNVPDSKYLVVSYWANVLDDGNGIFEADNSIEIYGWENMSRTEHEKPSNPLYPSVSDSSGNVAFSVYKFGYNAELQEIPLTGAEFKLEQLTYHPENDKGEEFQLDSSSGQSEWDGVPKTYTENGVSKIVDGVFDFTGLPKGAIFRLTETQVPDGFVAGEPIYFIFENYDENKVYTHNTVSSDELLGLTDYNIQVFSYNEQIRVENRAKKTTAAFRGNKEIEGREWNGNLDSGAYSFTLEALDGAPMPDEALGESTYTVNNDGHTIAFPPITYTEADVYRYTIKEIPLPDDSVVPKITSFDSTIINVEVRVLIDEGSPYVESVTYSSEKNQHMNGSFEFINTYNEPETGRLNIAKKVTGSAPGSRAQEYTFTISGPSAVAGKTFKVEKAKESEVTFSNDSDNPIATITIVGNNTASIYGLNPGVYTVHEEDANVVEGYLWEVSYDPVDPLDNTRAKVIIPNDGNVTVAITNNYTEEIGDVVIQKSITGEAPENITNEREFTFTIEGTEVNAGKNYKTEDGRFITFSKTAPYVASISVKGPNSVKIMGLPLGTYIVTENLDGTAIDDYELTVTGTGSVSIDQANRENQITITNDYELKEEELKTGNLIVSKTVSGEQGETEREFHFTVRLSDSTINGTYDEMEFTNGVADFVLKHGLEKKATGLPAGITYTVTETEANQDGYSTVGNNTSGSILEDTDITASFINSKPAKFGNLVVSKTVSGEQGETDREFHFTVRLSDSTINGTYDEMEFTNGVADFVLKHGLEKKATGLPAGITYTVTETEANQDGYSTVGNNTSGDILEDTDTTASFINSKPAQFGNLVVAKNVSGTDGETDRAFNFTVNLSDKTINGQYGDMFFENGVAEFELKHGDTAKATGLPAGITHEVVEKEANQDRYETTKTEEAPNIIEPDADHLVSFENHRDLLVVEDETLSLSVTKKVSGVELSPEKTFSFTITLTLPDGYDGGTSFPYEITNATTELEKDSITIESENKSTEKVFKLHADDLLTIKELPVGTIYKVVEEKDPENNWNVEINGVSTADATSSATLNKDLNLTYLNKLEKSENKPDDKPTQTPEVKTGRLILSKLVSGNAPTTLTQNKVFTLEITGPNTVSGKTYTMITDGGTVGNVTFNSNKATVTIQGNQKISIYDLPFGNYTVSESPIGAGIDGYIWNVKYLPVNGTVSVTELAPEGTVLVTNTYIKVDESGSNDYEEPEDIPEDEEQVTTTDEPVKIKKEQSVTRHNSEGYSQSSDGIKTTGYIEVRENDVITYYLTVTNQSAEPLRNVIITDPVPDGLVLVSNSASLPENLTINGNTLTWKIAEIGAYQNTTVQMQFQVKVPQIEGEIYWKNTAYVDYEDNTHGPWSSNEVVVGDPPANTNQSTGTNNASSTTTSTTSSPQNTVNKTSVSSVGISPQTGITGGLSIVFLSVIAGSATCVEFYNRKKKNKK